jgi:hypothetical protein
MKAEGIKLTASRVQGSQPATAYGGLGRFPIGLRSRLLSLSL